MLTLWLVMCSTLSMPVARLLQLTWMHSCSDYAVAYALPADLPLLCLSSEPPSASHYTMQLVPAKMLVRNAARSSFTEEQKI